MMVTIYLDVISSILVILENPLVHAVIMMIEMIGVIHTITLLITFVWRRFRH